MKSLLSKALLLVGYASYETEAKATIKGREPGLALHFTEGFFKEWKEVMQEDYIQLLNLNKDKLWPKEFKGAMWKVSNIHYEDMALNFDRFNIDFEESTKEVKIDFPLMKSFVAHANFEFNHFLGMFAEKGKGTVKVGNMELKAIISEKV